MKILKYLFVLSICYAIALTFLYGLPLLSSQASEILGTPEIYGIFSYGEVWGFFFNPIIIIALVIVTFCNIVYCKSLLKELEKSADYNKTVKPPFSFFRLICLLAGSIFLIFTTFYSIKMSLFYASSFTLYFEAISIFIFWALTIVPVIPAFVFSIAYMSKLSRSKPENALYSQARNQLRLLYVALSAYSIPAICFIIFNIYSIIYT